MINDLIKRLRKAADALDSLLEFNPNENKEVMNSIVEGFNDRVKKKKKHWTQLPKNKAKLAKVIKKLQKARLEKSLKGKK